MSNREIKAEKQLVPATEKDLYLYKGMGASYLCIASKAGIEFSKAVGVATATYVQVIEGKHGGLIKELGNKKLERKKLFSGAEFQIVTTALQYCPNSIPKDVSKKVNEIIEKNKK
ncbi:Villin headpiece domain-containing protein [Prochlorococcus marinus]|uniref:Villin headpiece domain-containing protein n=1 Tax=Prochlorococcus marinus TaxID=1219 RepID=UPI001FD75A3A|nr:Villin headpiece domain-containing protein [Prochlorococcus marinus]